jgi:hypothetical protein
MTAIGRTMVIRFDGSTLPETAGEIVHHCDDGKIDFVKLKDQARRRAAAHR